MRIVGLDGRRYSWNISIHEFDPERACSSFHNKARVLLQRTYPLDRILEEVPLPGSGGLTADFYLPRRKLLVEVHGQQHYEFMSRFHKDQLDFLAGQRRDKCKREWCELNGIEYIELPWYESEEDWRTRL